MNYLTNNGHDYEKPFEKLNKFWQSIIILLVSISIPLAFASLFLLIDNVHGENFFHGYEWLVIGAGVFWLLFLIVKFVAMIVKAVLRSKPTITISSKQNAVKH